MRRAVPLLAALAFTATAAAAVPGVTASVERVSATEQRIVIENDGSTLIRKLLLKERGGNRFTVAVVGKDHPRLACTRHWVEEVTTKGGTRSTAYAECEGAATPAHRIVLHATTHPASALIEVLLADSGGSWDRISP